MITSSKIVLVVRGGKTRTTIPIGPLWVRRWQFLDDIVNEMGVRTIEWTRTRMQPIRDWIELNKRMDEERMVDGVLLPIGGFADVIEYMNPYTDEYLQYVYIEETLPTDKRRDLYHRLGRHVREVGERWEYLRDNYYGRSKRVGIEGEMRVDLIPGIHYNLRLGDDILYSDIPREEYPPGMIEKMLESQVSTSTGILHTAWLYSHSDHYQEENPLEEVPWHLVRWDDLIEMAPDGVTYDVRGVQKSDLTTYVERLVNGENVTESVERGQYDHKSGQLNLWHRLAGRPPSPTLVFPLAIIPMREEDGRLMMATPAPELLLRRLVEEAQYNNEIAEYILLNYREEYIEENDDRVLLDQVISRLVLGAAWGEWRRTIDSSEYEELCQLAYESLGSAVVDLIANSAISYLEEMQEGEVESRMTRFKTTKLDKLAEAAIKQMSDTPYIGFQHWPLTQEEDVHE